MTGHRDVNDVLKAAEATLDLAQLGLEDFLRGDRPRRKKAGLINVITFGRSVTFVLQNIRTFEPDAFNRWYEPRQAEMKADPHFQYLKDLRTQLLHEGVLGQIKASVAIDRVTTEDFEKEMQNPPPGAIGFGAGDEFGAAGWLVRKPDGSLEKFYVEFPTNLRLTAFSQFSQATTQLGIAPPDEPIDRLLGEYVGYLTGLVKDAQREFGHT
jgi:hypothetical protein